MNRCYRPRKTELVGMEAVQDVLELTLYSNYVKDEKIVSTMILAKPESGKTELMKKYRENRGIYPRRSITAYRAVMDFLDGVFYIPKNKHIGHIVIYDLSDIFSYDFETTNKLVQFFAAYIEEGLSQQGAYWIETEESKMLEGIKGGLLAGVNTSGFFTGAGRTKGMIRSQLLRGGFLSRLLLWSYDFSQKQTEMVFESIRDERYHSGKGFVDIIKLKLPKKSVRIRISKRFHKKVEYIGRDVADNLSEDVAIGIRGKESLPEDYEDIKGFRIVKSMISLAKASALRERRRVVIEDDVNRISYLSNWMNLRLNKLRPYPKDFTGERW